MRLTHLGHACLLAEFGDTTILIDPGTYAGDFDTLTGLDAIVITHQHPDHADPERLPGLVERNPDAVLLAEPQAARLLAETTGGAVRPQPLETGDTVPVDGVTLHAVGDLHAVIHPSLDRIDNRGIVLRAENEPVVFHPGDSYDADPGPVDVLAVPLNAPWAKLSETADFVNRIAPRFAVPIHDGLLGDTGRALYLRLVRTFGPETMELRDLKNAGPAKFTR
jgi:L-ascorbate metabolism protein UlaG (beta-lactamase superfamily)